jgi:hypothetical protein
MKELLEFKEEIEGFSEELEDSEFKGTLKIITETIKDVLSPNRIIIENIKNNLKP